MAEFRITFSIQQGDSDEDDFWEIGFGSSSAWGSIDAALHDIVSAIQNRQWETEDGMPDPAAADEQEAMRCPGCDADPMAPHNGKGDCAADEQEAGQ